MTISAPELLDWHPRIQRKPDPRQGDLFAKPQLVMNVISW
jgi:hypothetical protein